MYGELRQRSTDEASAACLAAWCHCLACLPPHPHPPHRLPSITVSYEGLSVETDAAVGAAGIPSLTRWLGVDRLLRLTGGGGGGSGCNTIRLPILREVKGLLRPVSEEGARPHLANQHELDSTVRV